MTKQYPSFAISCLTASTSLNMLPTVMERALMVGFCDAIMLAIVENWHKERMQKRQP